MFAFQNVNIDSLGGRVDISICLQVRHFGFGDNSGRLGRKRRYRAQQGRPLAVKIDRIIRKCRGLRRKGAVHSVGSSFASPAGANDEVVAQRMSVTDRAEAARSATTRSIQALGP
jgi:hypothetical protein